MQSPGPYETTSELTDQVLYSAAGKPHFYISSFWLPTECKSGGRSPGRSYHVIHNTDGAPPLISQVICETDLASWATCSYEYKGETNTSRELHWNISRQ